MVLVYLPTKLGDFVRGNVGIHIPAPWFAYGTNIPFNNRSLKWLDQSTCALWHRLGKFTHAPPSQEHFLSGADSGSEIRKKNMSNPLDMEKSSTNGAFNYVFFPSLEIQSKCRMVFCRPRLQDHGSGMWFSNPNHTGTQWDAIPKGIGRTCSVRVWCWCGLSLIELNIDTTHQADEHNYGNPTIMDIES